MKMWYVDTAVKWIKTGSFPETWMDLESVIQSEVSQKEKRKYCIYMKSRKMVLMNLFVRQE